MATATILKAKPVITLTLSLEEACALYLVVSHCVSINDNPESSPMLHTDSIQSVLDELDLPYITSNRYIEQNLRFKENTLDSFDAELENT